MNDSQGILQNKGDIDECSLTFLWRASLPDMFSMATQKSFKYFSDLNNALIKMDESGQLKKLQSKYFLSPKRCESSAAKFKSLGYDKTGSVFIFLGSATLLSIFVLVLEKLSKVTLRKVF